MAITINKMITVAREGSSATLKFCDNVITKVGDDTYVKLVPQGSSLVRMICDNNVHAPSPMPKNFSLTSAIGYQTIMRLRNEAQIAELSTPSESKLSKLFGDAELLTPPKPKRLRQKRDEISDARKRPEALIVTLTMGNGNTTDVSVLRPVHPKDGLCVLLREDHIEAVIDFMRDGGFESSQKYKQDPNQPAGVWRRAKGFIVPYRDNGITRYRSAADVGDALAKKSVMPIQDMPMDSPIAHGEGSDVD